MPVPSSFERQRFGEPDDRRLRRGIGADARQRIRGAAAGQLDDLAVPMALEMRHEGASRQDGSVQVDLDRPDPGRPVHGLDWAQRAVHAGVVDEDVHLPKRVERAGNEAIDVRRIRDVCRLGDDRLSGPRHRANVGQRLVEPVAVACADQDARPGNDVGARDLASKSLAGPGHDRRTSRQRKAHVLGVPTAT